MRAVPVRVMLTGASGFVGSHIEEVLIDAGHAVLSVDRGSPRSPGGEAEFHACDVRDTTRVSAIVEGWQPNAIVHAAAITSGDDERDRALEIVQVNQLSTLTLLTAAARTGCRRFVYLSSAGVYADPSSGSILDERSPLADPGGLYAQTKIASERHCRWATDVLGLATVALRIGPVYGLRERPTSSRDRMSAIYRILELVRAGHDITCSDSETIYNWIHGDDVGRAVELLLVDHPPAHVYNLAGADISMSELLDTLTRVSNRRIRYRWVERSDEANLLVSAANRSRPISSRAIERDLGFVPRVDLETGLRDMLDSHMDDTAATIE